MRDKKSITLVDIYQQYIKNNEFIEYCKFKTILDAFNEVVLKHLLEHSGGFKMPLGLGYIQIVKYKPKTYSDKSLSTDYKSSKEFGKKIYHLNEHSDGYKFRLYWSKVPMTFTDRYKYSLTLVRQNKRKLAQLIFKHHDYINIDDIQIYKM